MGQWHHKGPSLTRGTYLTRPEGIDRRPTTAQYHFDSKQSRETVDLPLTSWQVSGRSTDSLDCLLSKWYCAVVGQWLARIDQWRKAVAVSANDGR